MCIRDRYYTVAQIEVFNVIHMLRELDMPLSDIKAYLDRRSPQELVSLLKTEEEKLHSRLKSMQRMEKLIHRKADLTCQAMQLDLDSIGPVSYTHLDVYKRQDLRTSNCDDGRTSY